jgi:HSP20 family molecular chaperone IbpA
MATVTPYHLDRVIDNFLAVSTHRHDTYAQYSDANSYTIEAPMIGVVKEDLSISVESNRLIVRVKGSVKSRFTTNFARDWVLNDDADVSAINANLANGLLTLTVPRVKPVQRTVNITVQ